MVRLVLVIIGVLCGVTATAAAQNNCPGGLCGPGSILSWNQPDGTTTTSAWVVKFARSPNVCTATTGVTTVNVTTSSLGLTPGTPGPLTVNLPITALGTLTNGTYWVNVAATGPAGTTPCDGEISLPFVGTLGATPTGLGVR
jgi:hypothetical protein